MLQSGCSGGWREVRNDEAERVREAAGPVADELTASLLVRLVQLLDAGDIDEAVEACKLEALSLTEDVRKKSGVIALRRTTHKPRNPKNAPDRIDQRALRAWLDAAPSDRVPDDLVFRRRGKTPRYRYYRPMYAAESCLECHGERNTLRPQLRKMLRKSYPEDKATGFREGDFRGVIVVEMKMES